MFLATRVRKKYLCSMLTLLEKRTRHSISIDGESVLMYGPIGYWYITNLQ